MAKKEPSKVKTTLLERAAELKLEVPEKVTDKQLRALIKTEELKADLPKPPPPPPALKVTKLKGDIIKVVVGPGKGARVLQGRVTKNGEDVWIDLTIVSPPGAPNIKIAPEKKVKKLRLMLGNVELETAKV